MVTNAGQSTKEDREADTKTLVDGRIGDEVKEPSKHGAGRCSEGESAGNKEQETCRRGCRVCESGPRQDKDCSGSWPSDIVSQSQFLPHHWKDGDAKKVS